jgi:hypothetical protein
MTQAIANLGEIGLAGTGTLRPFDLTLQRGGTTWVLNGYTDPTIVAWRLETREALAAPGTVAVQDAAEGVVRWTPGADVAAESGTFEGRVLATPSGGGTPEPSGVFRWSIGAGANP